MGQKVHPNGFRIGFNQTWTSHWFAGRADYVRALREDEAIRTIVEKRYRHSGVARIDIFRNRGDIVVTIHTSKPGIIIGRSGAGIADLRAKLEKALMVVRNDHSKKPMLRLTINELRVPELSAKLVAEGIASQIERRIAPKRAMRLAIERTMEKRALGIKIQVSGRLNGAEIARTESASRGSIPLQTLKTDLSYAIAEARTTYGVIGIKVWINLGQSAELPIASAPEAQSRPQGRGRGGHGSHGSHRTNTAS
jgi:small subunit ribosomal protein S3